MPQLFSGGGEINTGNDNASDPTTVIALAPIQFWRWQWFGITGDSGVAADTAISTSDGMPNLLKYALGLDPLVPAANPIIGDISTGYLRLSVPRNPNATDVTFLIEVTDNLTTPWTTNGTTVDQNTPNPPASPRQHAGQFIRRRLHPAADHPPVSSGRSRGANP